MDFLYDEITNPYELVNYYKDIHEYYSKNKQKIYNILKGLNDEIVIEDNKSQKEETSGDFSNFYFFYIQNLKSISQRGSFRLKNVRQLFITNADDFLVGLNLSKLEVGSDIRINLLVQNRKKYVSRIIITEKNKNNLFFPINNKDFFPFFLSNENTRLELFSNKNISEIDAIYLKLHRNYSNKFRLFGSYIMNVKDNMYLEFKDYMTRIIYSNEPFYPNEYLFYWNLEKYYGRKIFNSIKKYQIKKFIKEFITEEYDIYDDISNTLCKFI